MTHDPALRDVVVLTQRYKLVIVAATLVVGGAGAALGTSNPRSYVARAVLQPAEIAPEGAVENVEASASRMETFIESQVMTEALPRGTRLDVIVLRDQPPSSLPVNLLDLQATARTAAQAEKALAIAIEELKTTQNPLYEGERERLAMVQAQFERDLERLSSGPVSKGTHEATTRVILELSETERRRLPVRSHPLEVLLGPSVEPVRQGPRIVAFTSVGVVLGIALGYLIALIAAGLRAVRAAT